MEPETFASLLKARRKALNIATQADLQRQLARKVDISINSISYWETGERAPRRAHLDILLDVLNVRAEERDAWVIAAFAVTAGRPANERKDDASDVPAPSDADAKVA